jgi:prepilin-type N-terminal cleavage/methylation domain-containing protein
MKKLASKGFTLIELLVVITIIGILATGATTVYTTAQQKARDSVRQSDVMAVKSATEQYYSDNTKYPTVADVTSTAANTGLVGNGYIDQLPDDPKTNENNGVSKFLYVYGVEKDSNGIQQQLYEISANFESTSAASKETADGGDDNNQWEVGVGVAEVLTVTDANGVAAASTNDPGDGTAVLAVALD